MLPRFAMLKRQSSSELMAWYYSRLAPADKQAGSIHWRSSALSVPFTAVLSFSPAVSTTGTQFCWQSSWVVTKFIATCESLASDAYKSMLVTSNADDVLLTRAFTGLETNMLRASIVAAGLDPANLPERGMIDVSKDIDVEARADQPKRWRDIWSAGHSVSGVSAILPVAELIARSTHEYQDARRTVATLIENLP